MLAVAAPFGHTIEYQGPSVSAAACRVEGVHVRASAKVPLSWQGYALVIDYGNMRSTFYPLLRFLYRLVGKGGCLRCLGVVWCTI
mgnify:CR=1 FL=1